MRGNARSRAPIISGSRKLPSVAGIDEIALRRQQLEADHRREDAADGEHHRDHDQVEDCDPLVVDREQPRANAVVGVEIVEVLEPRTRLFGERMRRLHGFFPSAAAVWPSDRTYAISSRSCSSVSCPWNVGICGAYPATI